MYKALDPTQESCVMPDHVECVDHFECVDNNCNDLYLQFVKLDIKHEACIFYSYILSKVRKPPLTLCIL